MHSLSLMPQDTSQPPRMQYERDPLIPQQVFFFKKTHMESPQVCKIFIGYLHLGPPGCKVTTLPPARLLQGREAQERHAWALCWLHRVLSSSEGRMPVAGPRCKVPAGQPCSLPRAGALIWAWLPTLDIHSHFGYFCNRIPPTVD